MKCLLLLMPLLFLLWGGCEPPAAGPPALIPVPPRPDMAGMDPPVRQQIEERYAFLEERLEDSGGRGEGLGWAFGQLGKVLHAYRLLEPALDCYRNARALDPAELRWHYYLANVERSLGELERSDEAFLAVVKRRPGHVPSLVWLGENALDQGRLDEAEDRFRESLERRPRTAKASVGLARVALARGQPEGAIQILEPVVLVEPQAFQVLHTLAQAHQRLGQEAEARRYLARLPVDEKAKVPIRFDDPFLQEVSDLRRSSQYHARLGSKAIARGRFREAVGFLERSLEANPGRADTRYNLAASLLRLGRREEAEEQARILTQEHPTYALGYGLLARLLERDGDVPAAREQLRQGLEVDPRAEPLHVALGDLALREGRFLESLESYAAAREIAPQKSPARFGAVVARMRLGEWREALADLEASVKALPAARDLSMLLARMLVAAPVEEMRDGPRGLALAELPVGESPELTQASMNEVEALAMALAETGEFTAAIRWQRAVVERLPEGERRALAASRLALYEGGRPCREPWPRKERLSQRPLISLVPGRPLTAS